MRKFGAPEEVIREKLGWDQDRDLDVVEIEIFAENMKSVEVFQYCQPELLAGLSGFMWKGLASQEIESTCRLLRVKRSKWPQILQDVHFMGSISAKLNNQKRGSR